MFINNVPIIFNGTKYDVRVEDPLTYLENNDFLIVIKQISKLKETQHEHYTEYQKEKNSEYRVSAFHKRPKRITVDSKEIVTYDIVSVIEDVRIETITSLQTLITALNNRK